MPIPIAKEQKQFDVPTASSVNTAQTGRILPINTGLQEAVSDVVNAGFSAHNVMAQIKVDNDTAKGNELTLELQRNIENSLNSTEVDENGNVIGFLHKEGNEAFNNIKNFDKTTSAMYNNYLKEMSGLSPVAIQKLLLKGQEIVQNAQDKAFNYAYEQHRKYNINNATVANENIISQAKGEDSKITDSVIQDLDLIHQNNAIIARGQSPEYLNYLNRVSTEKYFTVALANVSTKYSNVPLLEGGGLFAKNMLEDAFNKKLISQDFRTKMGKEIDKDIASNATTRATFNNYEQAKKIVENRVDLTASEKAAYLNSLESNMTKARQQSSAEIVNYLNADKFREIPQLPARDDVMTVVEKMINNPTMMAFDDDKKQLSFIHKEGEKYFKLSLKEYVERLNLHQLYGKDVTEDQRKWTESYITDIGTRIAQSVKNGMTVENMKKLRIAFEEAKEVPLSEADQDRVNAFKQIKSLSSVKNATGDGKTATAVENSANLESNTERLMHFYDGSQSSREAAHSIAKGIGDAFKYMMLQQNEDNQYDQVNGAVKDFKKHFVAKEDDFLWFDSDNAFISYTSDMVSKYNKVLQRKNGIDIVIPTTDGAITAVYKGNLDVSNVITRFTEELMTSDWFMGANGFGISAKLQNLSDAQKEDVAKLYEKCLMDEAASAAFNDTDHLIEKTSGMAVSSRYTKDDKNRDIMRYLSTQLASGKLKSSGVVSQFVDLKRGGAAAAALFIDGTIGLGTSFFAGPVIGAVAGISGSTANAALIPEANPFSSKGPVAVIAQSVFGEGSFSQERLVDSNLKSYTVFSKEYNEKPSIQNYVNANYTPIIDYTSEFGKEELPLILNNLGDFIRKNSKEITTRDYIEQALSLATYENPANMASAAVDMTNINNLPYLAKQKVLDKRILKESLHSLSDNLIDDLQNKFKVKYTEQDLINYTEKYKWKYKAGERISAELGNGDKVEDYYNALWLIKEISNGADRNTAYFNFNSYEDQMNRGPERFKQKVK